MTARDLFPGCGATYAIGTDRHPCTVVRVEGDGARVGIVTDVVYGTGVFSPAPVDAEPERWFEQLDDGSYRLEGLPYGRLELGTRCYYRDPDFGPREGLS